MRRDFSRACETGLLLLMEALATEGTTFASRRNVRSPMVRDRGGIRAVAGGVSPPAVNPGEALALNPGEALALNPGEGAVRAGRVRALRATAGGFSLIELMVVVTIIALIALIATPTFSVARNDRLCFDYARQVQQLIHKTRSRAAGRGAAHLLLMGPGVGRGNFRTFEALDGPTVPGPNPVSSCKQNVPPQWTEAIAWAPGAPDGTRARLVHRESLDLDLAGINTDMDVRSALRVRGATAPFVVICVTPAGITYVGAGGSANAAVTDMLTQPPFNDVVEIDIQRHRAGVPVGLKRRVIFGGEGAPRIQSE